MKDTPKYDLLEALIPNTGDISYKIEDELEPNS